MNIHEIIEAVEQVTGVTYDDMIRDTKRQEMVEARQYAMYLAYKDRGKVTLREIGSHFERDHATVYYSHKTINERQEFCKDTRKIIRQIESIINHQDDYNLCNNCIQY